MTLEEKVEVIETTDSHASAIRPFDRYLSDVLTRKNENAPAPASEYAWQATAQAEPRRPSDNAAGETSSGSEKLRTEIIARVREADAPEHQEKLKEMRAALDRWMKETKDLGAIPEAKFKQEQALRLLSEQRLAEIEAEYKQRLASAQVAYFSRLELELALAESEVNLKQESESRRMADTMLARTRDEAKASANAAALASEEAEKRIVELELALAESEVRLKEESEARRLADTVLARTRDEAKASANAAALASEEAEKRIVELEGELEARDRDIEERTAALKSATLAWHEAERRIAELVDAIEKAEVAVRAREETIAKRRLAEMEVALKDANRSEEHTS